MSSVADRVSNLPDVVSNMTELIGISADAVSTITASVRRGDRVMEQAPEGIGSLLMLSVHLLMM